MKYKERDKQHQSELKKDVKFAQRERERERGFQFLVKESLLSQRGLFSKKSRQ